MSSGHRKALCVDVKLCFRSLKRRSPSFLQSGASHSIFNAKSSLKLSERASCRMYEALVVSSYDIILKTNISVPLWHFELGRYSYCSSFSRIPSHLLYFNTKKYLNISRFCTECHKKSTTDWICPPHNIATSHVTVIELLPQRDASALVCLLVYS